MPSSVVALAELGMASIGKKGALCAFTTESDGTPFIWLYGIYSSDRFIQAFPVRAAGNGSW